MVRSRFRVEVNRTSGGREKYYLVKDVSFRSKKAKVRAYLGTRAPTPEEVKRARKEKGYQLEVKAIQRRAGMSAPFYRTEYLNRPILTRLEYLRHLYQTYHSYLTTNELMVYERDFEVKYISGTTKIEGNTLSDRQAMDLLVNDIVPKGKSLREINEVQNFRNVIRYRNDYRGRVTSEFIRTLHSLIMANIDHESAGSFRRMDDIGIEGYDLRVTPSILIEEELSEALLDYERKLDEGYHPFEQAILFHYRFETIHPFTDGNGRVGREVLNYMLRASKFPRLLFPGKEREIYIKALRMGNRRMYRKMVEAFSELIIKQRLKVMMENLSRSVGPARTKAK